MVTKKFTIVDGLLHLPISITADKHYVSFKVNGFLITEVHIGLSSTPDFWCPFDCSKYIGNTVEIESDEAVEPAFSLIQNGGAFSAENPLYAELYHEAMRPAYHFSSKRGWLNDPNGLYFDGKLYHLYYQHNPYGITHGGVNISWGHAVSTDGVHWVERPDAIRTWGSNRHIASGSCIIDENGVAGYGKGAVIAAFTHLASVNYRLDTPDYGTSDGQFLAYSNDGGNSFVLFENNPAIPTLDGMHWRDPRLFVNPDGSFGIAVYEYTDHNIVTFYRSEDLHNWTTVSHNDDFFECPDIFMLHPDDGSEPRWVLYGADGKYLVGNYENGIFTSETERIPLDWGVSVYAGQTWTGRDDSDGRMHICWMRDDIGDQGFGNMPFSQQMGIPCLLTLDRTENGYYVNRNPIPEIDNLHNPDPKSIDFKGKQFEINIQESGDLLLEINATKPLKVGFGRFNFVYDPLTGDIAFNGKNKLTYTKEDDDEIRQMKLRKNGTLKLRLLTDIRSMEFFLQGEISASYGFDTNDVNLKFSSEDTISVSGQCFEMRSIHE